MICTEQCAITNYTTYGIDQFICFFNETANFTTYVIHGVEALANSAE